VLLLRPAHGFGCGPDSVGCTVARWESQAGGASVGTARSGRRPVVAKVTGPLGPRRGIAAALKQLREDRGKRLTEVAQDLMMSSSKLSRLENAQGTPLPRDIRDLIRYYQIEGTPLAARLERWVRAA